MTPSFIKLLAIIIILFILTFCSSISCVSRAFVKGNYDQIERDNLLSDKFSETDLQKSISDLISNLKKYLIKNESEKKVLLITRIQNKTSENIDMQSIADMIQVELIQSNLISFIDKEARPDIKNEKQYMLENEMLEAALKEEKGADYILNGRLDSIIQEAGSQKTVYYKLTLILTDLKSGIILWADHSQIRKKYRKHLILAN